MVSEAVILRVLLLMGLLLLISFELLGGYLDQLAELTLITVRPFLLLLDWTRSACLLVGT